MEVKTTLKEKDVHHFLDHLKGFTKYFPENKNKKIYGAMAYLRVNKSTKEFVQKKGLFLIRAMGSSASIINEKDFKPKEF